MLLKHPFVSQATGLATQGADGTLPDLCREARSTLVMSGVPLSSLTCYSVGGHPAPAACKQKPRREGRGARRTWMCTRSRRGQATNADCECRTQHHAAADERFPEATITENGFRLSARKFLSNPPNLRPDALASTKPLGKGVRRGASDGQRGTTVSAKMHPVLCTRPASQSRSPRRRIH